MITGDSRSSAEFTGEYLHINNIIAEVLPGNKQRKLKTSKRRYSRMVGDGIMLLSLVNQTWDSYGTGRCGYGKRRHSLMEEISACSSA
jgi:phosphoenolpyruvate carboxylase